MAPGMLALPDPLQYADAPLAAIGSGEPKVAKTAIVATRFTVAPASVPAIEVRVKRE
jgi:hypothetical protein